MKRVRLPLLIAAAVVLVFIASLAVAFSTAFQTWAARRALASQPGVQAHIGSVSAGFRHVEATDVRLEREGMVLTLPRLEASLPLLSAGLRDKILVSRLVAKGWTLDLSKVAVPTRASTSATETVAGGAPAQAVAATAAAFAGIFRHLQLPFDLAVDGVALEGEIVLPAGEGRAKVSLHGGGFGAGREGKLALKTTATLTDPMVNALGLDGVLTGSMDTPRTFTRVATKLDATASGPHIPNGAQLSADLVATRSAAGETYAAAVIAQDRQLVGINAEFPHHANKLTGTWRLDVRDADIAPFLLGRPLPAFTARGDGRVDSDATFTAVHMDGRITATADRLTAIAPELEAIGAATVSADFDLSQRGDTIAVEKLNATIGTDRPVATLHSLQPFQFNPKTGDLQASDPASDVLGLVLQGVPLAWARPFLSELTVTGGDVRGELVAIARGGGMAVRSKTPLTVAGVAVSQPGKPLLQGVDLSLHTSADYTPKGWQAEIAGLTAKSGSAALLMLDARAGKLAGGNQPIKAAGKVSVDLPSLTTQPVAADALVLTSGDATLEFLGTLGETTELQAKLAVKNLVADAKSGMSKLPSVSADIRADLAPDGQITLNAPLILERDGRKSDLTLAGTLTPGGGARVLDAQVTSTQLIADDAKMLLAVVPSSEDAKPDASAPQAQPAPAPPWAGISGSLALHLKKIVYSDSFQISDVSGTLRLDGDTVKLEGLQAGLGEGGEAKMGGAVHFNRAAEQPYALDATLAVTEFEVGAFLQALNPGQPPTVEGRFNVASKLASRAASLSDLAFGAGGEFQLSSRGGVFRGLPVQVASKLEATGTIAAGIAKLGSIASALGGKSDKSLETIASRAQAVSELVNTWKAIPYDQLNVVLARDERLNGTVKNFTLISPEIRLSGVGQTTHKPGGSLFDAALAMEFQLRAQGRPADLMRYLGVLEPEPDNLGYAGCTLPLKVAGTLGKPDTSELNGRLAAIALEKSGVTEKATEIFNKLLGGGK